MAMFGYQQIPKNSNSLNRLEAVTEPPPGLSPVEMSKNEYQDMQKKAYEEQKMDKRVKRLEALMSCVKDLGNIERSMDTLSERLGVAVESGVASRPSRTRAVAKQAAPVQKPKAAPAVESPWYKKESKSHAGRFYWVNKKTGQTVWKMPEDWKEPESEPETETAPASKKAAVFSLFDKLSTSDAEAETTDAGYTSVSDYDSDFVSGISRAQAAYRSGFRADAPVFKPTSAPATSEAPVFRADAPVFQPTSSIEVERDVFLSHRLYLEKKGCLTQGNITMRANAEINYQ